MSFLQSVKAASKTAVKPVVTAGKDIKTEYVATRNVVQTNDLEGGIKETALRLMELVAEANTRKDKPFTDINAVVLAAQAKHSQNVAEAKEISDKADADRIVALQRVADEAVRMAAEARVKAEEARSTSSDTSTESVPASA